jgi:glyoxylase-like metal-dependent hydrolase (beta-lactamase superfamily II)
MILETMVVGPLEVNCYLIASGQGKEAVVIDPGDDGGHIIERIRKLDLSLRYILNTHGHFDHIGANGMLKEATGAELLIHKKDAPLLSTAAEHARSFGLRAAPSPPPDRFIDERDRIEVEGLVLQVLATPGHSEGGVSFLVDTTLFTGDTLFAGSIGRTDLPGGSFREIMISIQDRILPLGDHISIRPGHGPSSTIQKEKRTNPFIAELGSQYI